MGFWRTGSPATNERMRAQTRNLQASPRRSSNTQRVGGERSGPHRPPPLAERRAAIGSESPILSTILLLSKYVFPERRRILPQPTCQTLGLPRSQSQLRSKLASTKRDRHGSSQSSSSQREVRSNTPPRPTTAMAPTVPSAAKSASPSQPSGYAALSRPPTSETSRLSTLS